MFGGRGVKTSDSQPEQLFLTFLSPTSMTNYLEQELARTKKEKNTTKTGDVMAYCLFLCCFSVVVVVNWAQSNILPMIALVLDVITDWRKL